MIPVHCGRDDFGLLTSGPNDANRFDSRLGAQAEVQLGRVLGVDRISGYDTADLLSLGCLDDDTSTQGR